MRTTPGSRSAERAEKATHVGTFVGALAVHALASAVLVWTFGGAVDSWLVKGPIGFVVGAPWLLWLVRMPWAARDLFRALSRRPVAEHVRETDPGTDAVTLAATGDGAAGETIEADAGADAGNDDRDARRDERELAA